MMRMTIYDPFRRASRQFVPFSVLPAYRIGSDSNKRAYPTANLHETTDEFVITMDVPGIRKDDLSIRYEDGSLEVRGSRPASRNENATVHIQETFSGEFVRRFSLPSSIEAEKISASVEDGILTVRIPKPDEVKPRQIEIAA